VLNHTSSHEEITAINRFDEAEVMEMQLEANFKLPDEYMLGVYEIYTSYSHAATLACVEAERLKSDDAVRAAQQSKKVKSWHLDLILTTSFSRTSAPASDISKVSIEEERVGCLCMYCVPAGEVFPSEKLNDEASKEVEAYLKVNPRSLNLYIPYRHTCYRHEVPIKSTKSKAST
jgi:hypothetical protein